MRRPIIFGVLPAFVVACALLMAALILQINQKDTPHTKNHTPFLQEKMVHMLRLSVNGEETVYCSGTAIGQHAILTADHCYRDGMDGLRLDRSRHVYHIENTIRDDHDHIVFLLDGPPVSPVNFSVFSKAPSIGEKVFVVGFGEQQYPGTVKQGVVVDEYDPSDLDTQDGLIYTSIHVIPGDSGSAVFNEKGYIIGLITFSVEQDKYRQQSGVFPLRFTADQLAAAKAYVYKETLSVRHTDFDSFIHLTFPKH